MKQKIHILLYLTLLLLLPTRAHAINIGFDPGVMGQNYSIGDIFDLPLFITGLSDTPETTLGAFDAVVSFNPAILSFESGTIGDPRGDQLDFSHFDLVSLGFAGFQELSNAAVELFELSLDPIDLLVEEQLDAFIIATLQFKAVGKGATVLDLVDRVTVLSDALGDGFMNVNVLDGRIRVEVPSPATLFLVGIGLTGLYTQRKCGPWIIEQAGEE